MVLKGSCHCENIGVALETEIEPERIQVRACQCTFCRRHGARTATDPAGHLSLTVKDGSQVSRYVFGLRTAEFIVCARCGVFVAAVMRDPVSDRVYATLNVLSLDCRERFGPAVPVSFDGEDAEGRIERRRARWTPATLA